MKSIDAAAIGELLADFTENGTSRQGFQIMRKDRPADV